MTLMEKTACFTGTRRLTAEDKERLFPALTHTVEQLIGEGIRFFGVGGALGFDEMAARVVLSLRGRYPHIRLIAVLPCPDWNSRWSMEDRRRYAALLRQADKVVTLSQRYEDGCMQRRNRYLVDNSGVCVYGGKDLTAGTAYTVVYAEKQGKRLIKI